LLLLLSRLIMDIYKNNKGIFFETFNIDLKINFRQFFPTIYFSWNMSNVSQCSIKFDTNWWR